MKQTKPSEIPTLIHTNRVVMEQAMNLVAVLKEQGFINLPADVASLMSTTDQRVLIRSSGICVSPKYASELGAPADVIFIRNDGRALGTSYELQNKAYSLWPEDWTHFYNVATKTLKPITEYSR